MPINLVATGISLFLFSIASASQNPSVMAPITDHVWFVSHYQQILGWLGAQAAAFFIWLGVQVYNSFIKSKDKTEDKIDQLIEQGNRFREIQAVMLEDLKNIKYTMLSKDEAHSLIEKKIEYADKIRSRQ